VRRSSRRATSPAPRRPNM